MDQYKHKHTQSNFLSRRADVHQSIIDVETNVAW